MAVTQISRIQVRRGRKNSPTGIPQLAGGEIAWAVDSQELFIGNGSVSEGAPYVGNTKILTEHDNILSLVSSYKFAGDNPAISSSVARSIQSKLDETVSVLDFGAVGDGLTDNTAAFELAFSQLFGNTNSDYRKVLIVPNGTYLFDSDLLVPSYVNLVGETKNNTKLIFNKELGAKIIFVPAEEETLPTEILISNLTIVDSKTIISSSQYSSFENVVFVSDYVLSDPEAVPSELDSAVYWENNSEGLETNYIKFNSCSFKNVPVGVLCNQTVVSRTVVYFHECEFNSLDTGILLTGVEDQVNAWKFDNCDFKNTANHAIYMSNGNGTLIRESNFERCGVELDGTLSVPIVYFGQSQNNILIDCTSDRQQLKGVDDVNEAYVTEAYGADRAIFSNRNKANIQITSSYETIAIFSALNKYMEINYFLNLDNGDSRLGKLKISIDKENNQISLTDDYSCTSRPGIARGFIRYEGIDFAIMEVTEEISPTFGIPFIGSIISGNSEVAPGSRVDSIGNIDEATGLGSYYITKRPILPPGRTQTFTQDLVFTRDSILNIQFNAKFNDDSTQLNTLILEYRQEYPSRGSTGTISFDVSYGTSV